MSRLRVLHLGKYYAPEPGGIETVLDLLCRGEQASVDVRALVVNTTRSTVEESVGPVPVTRVGRLFAAGAVSIAPALPMWLAKAEADVIVLHEPNPMALVAYAVVRSRASLVVWYHSEVVRPRWQYELFYRPLLTFALRRAAAIVVSSPPMIDAPPLGGWRDKCVAIPFGLDVERFQSTCAVLSRAEAKRKESHSLPIVLFVGRLVAYKGVDVLIRSLSDLEARVVVVGQGPQREALEALARSLGVADRVHFAGQVEDDELLAWYRACDLLVLPSTSRQEAFGMVQLEAMLCGKPVVSTDVGTGVSWVNQHEQTGLVVPPNDPVALRLAVRRLLSDVDVRFRLGRQARERVLEHFTAGAMCRASVALYHRVAAPASEAGRRRHQERSEVAKRTFDIALSGAGLLVSAPLWAVIAVLIKLEDGGPVFYGQERSGRYGVPFAVRKFRSMIPDAERGVGAVQAIERDPRVTRIGRALRATAMDELPQLWNIFRGDMSFTGPRALRPGEIEVGAGGVTERLEDVPGFAERAQVRPGLTGIAQIYARRDIPRRRKFRYDLLYVRRASFWLDVRLILLSFWITFRGAWEARGAKF